MPETEFVFSFDTPTGCAQNLILEWLTLNPAGTCGPLCNIFLILIAILFQHGPGGCVYVTSRMYMHWVWLIDITYSEVDFQTGEVWCMVHSVMTY